jgi:biotin-(acetyl-CoA carboxylase) ligase
LVERNQEFAVIGLGINISSAPEIETATSLGLSDQVVIVADLLVEIKNAANQIQILTDKEIQEFISPLISTIGKNVEVTNLDGSVTIGHAVGIGLNGALLLSEGTSTIEILSGDVKHLRDADER